MRAAGGILVANERRGLSGRGGGGLALTRPESHHGSVVSSPEPEGAVTHAVTRDMGDQ